MAKVVGESILAGMISLLVSGSAHGQMPPFPLAEGNWEVRLIGVEQRPPAPGFGDGDINSLAEALAILDYVGPHNGNWSGTDSQPWIVAGQPGAGGPTTDESLNLNNWGVWTDHLASRNVIDMGDGGEFASDHPYPGPTPPNFNGNDFIVKATTASPLNFAPGQYAINFGSDDGGYLKVIPADGSLFQFDAERGERFADAVLGDDTITYGWTRGHGQTCGEFTVGPDGLSAHIESVMFDRGGFDNFEISMSSAQCIPFTTKSFELLSDNSLPNNVGSGFLVTVGTPVQHDFECDLDGDGDCDQLDINELYEQGADIAGIIAWLTQASDAANPAKPDPSDVLSLGDVDLDGGVSSHDLGLLLSSFGKLESEILAAGTWVGGDLNNSGNVDSTDLGILLNNLSRNLVSRVNVVPELGPMPILIWLFFLVLGSRNFLRRQSAAGCHHY